MMMGRERDCDRGSAVRMAHAIIDHKFTTGCLSSTARPSLPHYNTQSRLYLYANDGHGQQPNFKAMMNSYHRQISLNRVLGGYMKSKEWLELDGWDGIGKRKIP